MDLDYDFYTHTGGKSENQDCILVEETKDSFYAVLCDGLGGMMHGAEASAFCAQQLLEHLKQAKNIDKKAMNAAFSSVQENFTAFQNKNNQYKNARSTACALVIKNDTAVWGNIGDTRIYHFSDGSMQNVSPDDSTGYAAFLRGEISHEEIREYDGRSTLTACLGDFRHIDPHIGSVQLGDTDMFLLCSDGFWQFVFSVEMLTDLCKSKSAKQWLNYMLLRLIQRSHLEDDNLTALTCMMKGNSHYEY
jgi:Serine/threonine protein phosphatase